MIFLVIATIKSEGTLKGFRLVDSDGKISNVSLSKLSSMTDAVYLNAEYDINYNTLVNSGSGVALAEYPILDSSFSLIGNDGVIVQSRLVDSVTGDLLGYACYNGVGQRFKISIETLRSLSINRCKCNFSIVEEPGRVRVKNLMDKDFLTIQMKREYSTGTDVYRSVPVVKKGIFIESEKSSILPTLGYCGLDSVKNHEFSMSAQKKVSLAYANLRVLAPYYGCVFDAIEKKAVVGLGNISASESRIYYDLDYVNSLEVPELTFLFMHVLCHILMRHSVRKQFVGSREKDTVLWTIATDMYVNAMLCDEFNILPDGEIYEYVIKDSVSGRNFKATLKIPDIDGIGVFPSAFGIKLDLSKDTPESIYMQLASENPEGVVQDGIISDSDIFNLGESEDDNSSKSKSDSSFDGSEDYEKYATKQDASEADDSSYQGNESFSDSDGSEGSDESRGSDGTDTSDREDWSEGTDASGEGSELESLSELGEGGTGSDGGSLNSTESGGYERSSSGSVGESKEHGSTDMNEGSVNSDDDTSNCASTTSDVSRSGNERSGESYPESTLNSYEFDKDDNSDVLNGGDSDSTDEAEVSEGTSDASKEKEGDILDNEENSILDDDLENTSVGKGSLGDSIKDITVSFNGQNFTSRLSMDLITEDSSDSGDSIKKNDERSKDALQRVKTAVKLEELKVGKPLSNDRGGDGGAFLRRHIDFGLSGDVNWRRLLLNVARKKGKKMYSLATPNRDYMNLGITLASRDIKKKTRLSNIVVAVDVSGSVTEEYLMKILSEIANLMRTEDVSILLMYWSTEVGGFGDIFKLKDLLKVEPSSTGGTDVSCVFDFLLRKRSNIDGLYSPIHPRDIDALVIITDGHFSRNYEDNITVFGSRTIWLIQRYPVSFDAVFGRVFSIDM